MQSINSLPCNENEDIYKNGLFMWWRKAMKLYSHR